jgi:hypothetical protein
LLIANFQILCVPCGRTHGRTHRCKWSLLKFKEGNYKREHGGPRWKLEARDNVSLFQFLLKLMLTWQRKNPGDSEPIISEWGAVWVVPG